MEYWQRVVAEHESSGQTVRAFCRQAGVNEHAFYNWRKRLRDGPAQVRFALVETGAPRPRPAGGIELTLATGERLKIEPGTDTATVRMVLAALRP